MRVREGECKTKTEQIKTKRKKARDCGPFGIWYVCGTMKRQSRQKALVFQVVCGKSIPASDTQVCSFVSTIAMCSRQNHEKLANTTETPMYQTHNSQEKEREKE